MRPLPVVLALVAASFAPPASGTPDAPDAAPFLPGERPDVAVAHLVGGPCVARCEPDVFAPCERAWKLKAGVALSLTSGNTDTFSLVGDVLVTRIAKPWVFKVGGAFVYQETEGETTAERFGALARVERDLDGWTYAFVQSLYDRDEPAGLEFRHTPTAGLGRVLWRTPEQELRAEVGGGLTVEQRVGLPETSDPSGYLGVKYWRTWADQRRFDATLDFTPNFGDFDLSVTRLALAHAWPIAEGLKIVAGARFDHVIDPPGGREALDTLVTLGISFER